MNENIWLPDGLTADTDLDLVSLVSSSFGYDVDKSRAFVVALLEDVNDHMAAIKVNDVLMVSEQVFGAMAELADAQDLKSCSDWSVGSIPTSPTRKKVK